MINNEKFLPLGTVVLLKGGTKRLMIIGYCAFDEAKKDKSYDYIGCLYPEGVISSKQMALFNHSQIQKIDYTGYSDEESKKFNEVLNESISQIMNGKNDAN